MSIIDLVKSLTLNIAPSWKKQTGANSSESKIRARKVTGDIAGRDIIKNTYAQVAQKQNLPYVYVTGAFGGNGHVLRFGGCQTYNLSDDFIVPERITLLGRTINFGDHPPIKSGESLHHTGIDDLEYPPTDEDRFVEIFFAGRNGQRFVARQKMTYESRQDGKFNINGLSRPTVELVDES